jgi:heparan sulfate N-deacetylase/N-sulfotransferase NDST2
VNGTKCLGQSKGRQYPDMDLKSKTYLTNFYEDSNRKLLNLHKKYAFNIPLWLKEKI